MATLLKTVAIGLAGAATLALGGCYDDGYGYSGVSVGVGTGYYGGGYGGYGGYGDGYGYDPYYDGSYGGYPAYGWFDGFYYPGSGYYIYDRGGRRFRMRDRDRQHWSGDRGDRQAGGWRGPGGTPRPGDGRWDGRRAGGQDQRGGQWQGNGGRQGIDRWRGGVSRAPGQSGANGGVRQQPTAEQRQAWTQRRQTFRQGQSTAPGAAPQRFEQQRTFTPRPSGDPGGRFRQRGTGRNPQP